MEKHIAELTAAQRKLGVRVTEIYNCGEPQGEATQLYQGRRLDRVRPYALRAALFYGAAARSRFDFSDARMRVVHVHGDWPSFLFGTMFARAIGARAVAATLHSTFHARPRRYTFSLRHCNPIFATGLREAQMLQQLLERPITHLPSAPSDLFFDPSPGGSEQFDVVAVGSLLPVKNYDLLLQCAALRPKYRFLVIGDGPERTKLEDIIARYELLNVTLHGFIPKDKVRAALYSSRIFINTSRTEGSPTALLEAMACGLPTVLTPANNYSDIVDQGVTGFVTAGWGVNELVEAIDSFLQQPNRLVKAGARARQIAEPHRWARKAELVTELMLAASDRQRNAGPW